MEILSDIIGYAEKQMSEEERSAISTHIEHEFGIKMPQSKKSLLSGRLAKRLRILKIPSFGEYFNYIRSPEGRIREYRFFADLVSTHETSFFRENSHFEHLIGTTLPDLIKHDVGIKRDLKVWSAACSSGEEVYSIAISIEEFARRNNIQSLRYSVTGTDISEIVLTTAARGIYNKSRIKNISSDYVKRYFLRSKKPEIEEVRIIPEVRSHTQFLVLNLMDSMYEFDDLFDVIFCRNVLIYFDRSMQEAVSDKLSRCLSPEGYMYIGHSESIYGFNLPLKVVAPTVYRKSESWL